MTHLEDSKIIALFYERSEQAIAELDKKYGFSVNRSAANILSDQLDIEECVNDTYLRAWNSIPPQNPNPLVSFICKIARNLALDKYRANKAEKRNREFDLILEEMEACIPSKLCVETEVEAKELSAAISRFLFTLSRDDRFLFVRRYWYADSIAELAAMTGGSANRISVRLFRIREKLKQHLSKEGYLA